MTITLTREEAQQVLDALESNAWVAPIGSELSNFGLTLRARLSAPEPEKSLSQKLADAGYTKRDDRLECDECGKKFTRQMLPIHDCQPEPEPVAWNEVRDANKNLAPWLSAALEDDISTDFRKAIEWWFSAAANDISDISPPQREWQGLTDEEIEATAKGNVEGERMLPYSFARAIEAKLREKNFKPQ